MLGSEDIQGLKLVCYSNWPRSLQEFFSVCVSPMSPKSSAERRIYEITSSLRAELHSRIINSYLEFTCMNAVLIFLVMSLFASTIRRSSRTLLNRSTPRVRTRPQHHSTSELTSDSPHYPAQCISNRYRCV